MEANKNKILSEMTIRKALPSDAEAIALVQKESWLSTYCSPAYHVTRENILAWFSDFDARTKRWAKRIHMLDWKTNGVWVAHNCEQILGFVAPKVADEKARVGAIYLLPEAQGKGIGSALLGKVFELFPDRDIYLDVVTYNTSAIRFYTKHGFLPTGERTMFPVEHEGNILFELPVVEYKRTSTRNT